MRSFPDTNVVVSAYTARGLCADLIRQILAVHELTTGGINLYEPRRVPLERFRAPDALGASAEPELREQTVVPEPDASTKFALRDPDDARVLALAIAARLDLLVSGDEDLLAVAADTPHPMVTSRGCGERLRG